MGVKNLLHNRISTTKSRRNDGNRKPSFGQYYTDNCFRKELWEKKKNHECLPTEWAIVWEMGPLTWSQEFLHKILTNYKEKIVIWQRRNLTDTIWTKWWKLTLLVRGQINIMCLLLHWGHSSSVLFLLEMHILN